MSVVTQISQKYLKLVSASEGGARANSYRIDEAGDILVCPITMIPTIYPTSSSHDLIDYTIITSAKGKV